MLKAFEQVLYGQQTTSVSNYDPGKVNLGDMMGSYSLGPNPYDRFVGPQPIAVMRPADQSTAIPPQSIYTLKYFDGSFFVFYADNSTASATRRIGLFNFNPTSNSVSWLGFITLTFPSATNHSVRGIAGVIDTYSQGTVSVSGTSVTGTGTFWQTDKIPVGARIGFGSSNPIEIVSWFPITSISTENTITLTSSSPTYPSGTPYVIEYLTLAVATTNATATNGGLFVVKGLNINVFTQAGTTIPAATTIDNIRAVYFLKDAATNTNTASGGIALDTKISNTEQYVYVTNGNSTSLIVYRYNIRAPLNTLTSGSMVLTGSDRVATGANTVVGSVHQSNNGYIATMASGPGNGIKSLYVGTTSTGGRFYRIPVTAIVDGSTSLVSSGGAMIENPPGGTSTHGITNGLGNAAYDESLDMWYIVAQSRVYFTQYREDAGQMDIGIGVSHLQLDGGSSSGIPFPHSYNSVPTVVDAIDGYLFLGQTATSTTGGAIFVAPIGADYYLGSSNQRKIICPKIVLTEANSFYSVYVDHVSSLPAGTFPKSPEHFKLYYRTTGIDDNTGSWLPVPDDGSLSGVSSSNVIQFSMEFKTAGDFSIPARIRKIILLYQGDADLPPQYYFNDPDSDSSLSTIGFIQKSLFGTSIPRHTIKIYDYDTGNLLLQQSSDTATNGVFEYWNGSSWVIGLGTDTINQRRRFRPTAFIPSNTSIVSRITLG